MSSTICQRDQVTARRHKLITMYKWDGEKFKDLVKEEQRVEYLIIH